MKKVIHVLRQQAFSRTTKNLFIRFVAVGIVNAAFGYGIFALMIYVGLHYAIAALLGTILGVLFNFKSTGKLVFGSRDNSLVFKFVGVYSITYVFNVVGLKLFHLCGVSEYIGGALLLIPMALIAFILQKSFVFKGIRP